MFVRLSTHRFLHIFQPLQPELPYYSKKYTPFTTPLTLYTYARHGREQEPRGVEPVAQSR